MSTSARKSAVCSLSMAIGAEAREASSVKKGQRSAAGSTVVSSLSVRSPPITGLPVVAFPHCRRLRR
ncbi:hypothetical protein QLR68_08055 [Micromonospora sp. DH15]|nr:hypothetical protein [Micromonospora sp. DH15]